MAIAPVLSVRQASPISVGLTWTDPSQTETAYEVQRKIGTGAYVRVARLGKNIKTWTDASPRLDVLLTYRVRYIGKNNVSGPWSNLATIILRSQITPPPPDGHTCTVTAANLQWQTVQDAIDNCPDGGTVCLPAGSVSWAHDTVRGPLMVDQGKQVYIRGAGMDSTIITDLGVDNVIEVVTVASKPIRISHLQIVGGTVDYIDSSNKRVAGISCILATGQGKIRVDHCKFDCSFIAPARPAGQGTVVQMRAMFVRDSVTGVFDQNYCLGGGGLRAAVLVNHNTWQGIGDYGDNSWAQPTGLGDTDSAFYSEYNDFVLASGTTATSMFAHDSHQGARSVLRYNTLQNSNFVAHGSEAGGRGRGTRSIECYGNTALNRTEGQSVFFNLRSGTIRIWGNTIGTDYTGLCRLDNDRSTQNFGTWLSSDGSFDFDLNDGVVYDSGTATAGSGDALLEDTTKSWTPSQWVGALFSIRNTSLELSDGDGREEGSYITANDATTITYPSGITGNGPHFHLGDTYQILRCTRSMDAPGLGQGDLLEDSPPVLAATGLPGWPSQASDPCYSWGNTIEGVSDNEMTQAGRVHIIAGTDFFNGVDPGYTPAANPHPLVTSGFTAGDAP